jgi:hypothetical protein
MWTSAPSSAEVKNSWSYASTPQYTFMVWCSFKAQLNLTFIFTCGGCDTGIIWISEHYVLKRYETSLRSLIL